MLGTMRPERNLRNVNPDLVRERSGSSFSTEILTNLLDGSAERTDRRRRLEALIELDPTGIFSNDDNRYLHRTERHTRALAKHVRLVELCRKIGIGEESGCDGDVIRSEDWWTLLTAVADDLPTALHWIMFVPNLMSLCDDEQKEHWLPLCRDWRVIGCYAQTELGHGSNVRGLETTATFLPENKGGLKGGSWVINSPTLTSSKFWPGTLGRTANHAVVIAQLIDGDGKNRGVHNFIVPLRSLKDHKPLPGVTTGDIGPKIGFNNMDNGFARFENVVVPRRNMAMRFASVDERGRYSKMTVSDATEKVAYITMMQVRAFIVNDAGKQLARACTVSVRYSAVRKQGFDESGKRETQILNYRQQQHRLLPLLATSYCFFYTGRKLLGHLQEIEKHLVTGSGTVTKVEVADLHASSSALKSLTTMIAADGIEECRKACGGHGFLHCSGLAELATTYLQNPTVEGDNHMLPQQVIKVLLKLVRHIQQDGAEKASKVHATCDSRYLIPELAAIAGGEKKTCSASAESAMMDLDVLIASYRHRSARLLIDVAAAIETGLAMGKAAQVAWNDAQVRMARASRAHAFCLLLQNFSDGVRGSRDEVTTGDDSRVALGSEERSVLLDLASLFALYWAERDLSDFLEDGYFSGEQAGWVRNSILVMLNKVRPNAVALVDAWDFSDFFLQSALGRYDGNVYPAVMEAAKRDPLNQTEPGPGYKDHLKRLIVDGVGVHCERKGNPGEGLAGTHARL